MLRIAATIGLKTYYFASEDVDYDNTFWEARISNQFEIERFFDISESTGNRIRSIQITLDNRDNFFRDIEKNDSLLNSKFVLYFNDGDDKVKTFTGIVNKIDSFGDDVSLTLMERGYEYLKNNFPDAQIAYDYYSESGINDSWNAIPIPFGIVNKIPLAWVNLLRSEFIIGSGPLFNVNKLYFDKVVVYDRITEKNGYQPTPESPEIKFRIFKGTGSIGSPEVVDGVKSEYPGFAYVQLYKIVDGVEEPADPLTPDGDVSQIYADIEGIVNDTGTAPERNPIKILYMLFTKPYTGYEGYGLEIDPDDLDFDDAILEANIQGFKIDGAIDRIAEFGEWVDELLRCARASLTEEDGKIKVYVDSAKTYSGVHFDASGVNGYECDISPWTEPEVDAQINRLRLSYSWNFERNDFNKKPGVHEESPLRDPYLKDEAHAVRIGKWNTDTIEFKLIKDDTTAHKLAQYYLKSKVKQLKTTSLVTEVNIPNIDAGDLVKVSYEKFGWVEKDFVVTKIKRNEDSTELDIKEYSIDVYTFVSPGEEPEVPGNPYSPYNIPTKPIMNSLEVVNTILQDGSNQTLIKVEFTHTSENAHMVALYFKEASEPESAFWQLDATVNKNVITTIWKGRVTGEYNFRLATITSMGVISPITIEDGDRHYYGQPTEEVPASVHVDTEAPGTPSISIVNPFVGGVSIYITIPDGVPEDFAYFKIFRKLGGLEPALLATYHTSAVFTDSERETIEHSRVYYAVAVDRNGNESAMSAASAASTPLKVSDADLSADAIKMPTGSLLSLTAKNCTTASIAEVGGVKDVSGNGNHGQAFGGVEVVDSEMGKAFRQSGTRYIQCSGAGLTATDRTFSCWIKKISETNAWSQILSQNTVYNLGTNNNLTGLWTAGNGVIRVFAANGVTNMSAGGIVPTPNQFYHVVGVIEGNVALKLYIDGVLVRSVALAFNPQTDGLPVFIGGLSSTQEFDCFDPRVYNRALSPSEIKTLYMFPGDVAFGQITTDFIGANAVTAGKTLLAAIDDVTGNLNNNVVGELQLVNDAVTEAKIAVNAVNTGQINNQALKAPSGALLSLTAKNCTTASIAEVGGVKDVSGNGNHGQAFGGVEVVDSEVGKAFKFSGGTGVAIVGGDLPSFDDEITLSAIINMETTSGRQGVIGNTMLGGAGGVTLGVLDAAPILETVSSSGGHYVGAYFGSLASRINSGKPYFIAVTINLSEEVASLYINGTLTETKELQAVPILNTPLYYCLGRAFANHTSYYRFNGLIAHPKIFNRALSPSEIKTLYMFPDDVVFGQITADLVTTGELITKSAQIADAIISNAHIHDLSADKINAGTLAAERIAAGSINASKLLIGRVGAALNDDPNFEDPSAWIKPINGTFATVTDGQVGGTVARQSVGYGIWRNVKYIPIDRSKTYRVRLWIRTDSAGNGVSKSVSIGTNYYTALGGLEDTWLSHSDTPIPITTSWTEFSYTIPGSKFPTTAKYMRNRIGLFNGNGTGYHEMQDLRIEEVIPATLIQDGSIITEKLAVGAVTAEKLLIGKSGAALNDDPNFEDHTAWEKSPYQPFNFNYTLIPDGKVGRYGIRSVSGAIASVMPKKDIPYDPSKTYRIRAWVRATVSTATPSYLGVRWINSSGDNGETSITIPVSPIDWTEYVVFIGDGTENIAPVDTVAVRPYFIANIDQVTGVVFDIQDLRIEECVPSTLIKDGAIRAQHITVEGLDAGKITSGELKSRNYVAPAVGESFAQAGSTYDLDNASIITENFYSNETGAGIKGHIEADTGRIGRWNIGNTGRLYVNVENFNEADPALELTADVSNEAEDERILQKVFLGWGGEDAELLLSQEESILSTGVPQDSWYTTIRPWRITCKVNNSSTTIDAYKIATYPLNSPKAAIVGDMGDGELKFTVMDNNQLGTLGVKTLTLAGKSTTTVTINADNPKIVFENMNHTQIAALVFSASDSYTPPMSVSLVGNQGNEVFAAPRFRANAPTGPASVLLSGGINSYGESAIFGLTQSGASPLIGYGVKPHPTMHGAFVSSYGATLGRTALLLDGYGFRVFTGGTVSVPVDTGIGMTERFKVDPAGVLTLNGYATSQRRDANGYLNFNGIKIAWGQFTSNATASQPITMHTEFVQPPRIALTLATSSAVTTYFARAYDRTTTSFYCNSNVTASVMYIAVGY